MRKLYFVKNIFSQLFDELSKKGIDKNLRLRDDGNVVTIELGDDWTDAEKETLKNIIGTIIPDKRFSREEKI